MALMGVAGRDCYTAVKGGIAAITCSIDVGRTDYGDQILMRWRSWTKRDRGRLHITKSREHPGIQMIEQMAVEGPEPGIVRIENDGDGAPRRHQYRVAHGAGKALAVDLDDLELVPVQVHRMRHASAVDHHELDSLPGRWLTLPRR